jgi:hypothetical protein
MRGKMEIGNYLVVAVVAFLAACQPPAPVLPVTGEISLRFVGRPESGLNFRLANQSSRAIYLRGSSQNGVGVDPWDAYIECSESNSDLWTEGPYALVGGKPASVEVGSGRQLDLIIGFEHHYKFIEEYKSPRCRFHVKLEDGTVIASDEFRP